MASVLSSDGKQDPDVVAANATSAALMLSDIPWDGPIGIIRIGRISGQFIVNPSMDEVIQTSVLFRKLFLFVCTNLGKENNEHLACQVLRSLNFIFTQTTLQKFLDAVSYFSGSVILDMYNKGCLAIRIQDLLLVGATIYITTPSGKGRNPTIQIQSQ